MIRRLALALIALGSMSFAQTAHADCTTANGAVYQPGGIIYNSAHAVLQYCAGTVWRSLGGAAGTDGPLPNLTDVDDALAPNDGECLIYNGTNTQWETGACGSGGGASDLADLGDVGPRSRGGRAVRSEGRDQQVQALAQAVDEGSRGRGQGRLRAPRAETWNE